MKRPQFESCPLCGEKDTLTMKKETQTKLKGGSAVKIVADVWTCSACKESFFEHWDIIKYPETGNA